MSQSKRILVVGAGPVGAITGLRLAQLGLEVTLFDRLATAPADHRAATLQPASHDIFAKLGIIREIERQGLKAPEFQWRDRLSEEVIANFDYGVLADETEYPFAIQLEQHKTVNIALEEALRYSNFEVVRPVEVIAVRQDEDSVHIDFHRQDGSVETREGSYLVGCDGGRSLVRKTLGVTFDGFTWEFKNQVITTDYDFQVAMNFKYRNYYIHPVRSCSVFKVPGENERGLWRCVFAVHPEETDEQVMGDEWINARFQECLPIGAPYPILHRNLYGTQNRVAGKFYEGRVILAGDAAHLNNPNGGVGMNSGFQDAMNIADKLKLIHEGAEAGPLLAKYDRQRRLTTMEFVQAQTIAGKKMMQETDLKRRNTLLNNMRSIVSDPVKHHDYLYKASLLAMQRKADALT